MEKVMIKFCKKCNCETDRNKKGECFVCVRAYQRNYRKLNAGKVCEDKFCKKCNKVTDRNQRGDCANCARERANRYYINNTEKASKANKLYAESNPEKVRECHKRYRLKNINRLKEYRKNWIIKNIDKFRLYKILEQGKRRELKQQNSGKLSKNIISILMKLQRGKCPCCKLPLGNNYHLDHIIPLSRGGLHSDDNLQLLRANCNLKKSSKDPIAFMQSRGFLI